jgi:hypothetical protein
MTLPWMKTLNTAPWNAQQPVCNRVVAIHRLKTVAGSSDAIGGVGYSGAEQSTSSIEGEQVLLTGISASIQVGAVGRTTKGGLPGDAVSKPVWLIHIPLSSGVPQYTIRDRDIIVDDEFYRYEVGANYWTALNGYQLSTIRLEA